jgi:hypothetical protein
MMTGFDVAMFKRLSVYLKVNDIILEVFKKIIFFL